MPLATGAYSLQGAYWPTRRLLELLNVHTAHGVKDG